MSAPYVNIELDKKRKLRYRHNDMADMEMITGKTLGELLSGSQFHGIRVVLAYGLRWMDTKMTPSKAGDLIQDHWVGKDKTLDELADKVEEALVAGGILKPRPGKGDDSGNEKPEAVSA